MTKYPGLVDTYKGIHTHPELSHHEEHTAALLAGELRKAGYTVTARIKSALERSLGARKG